MTKYTLIGSKISTRSLKHASSGSNISSSTVPPEDTEISKTSGKSNAYDIHTYYLKHAFIPKPDF
jgi:hypothetical protein